MSKNLNALVVEGGGARGIFATGLLDVFGEEGFNPFDLYIGVSAGAGNLAAYLANMPGRNLKIFHDYSLRKEFINIPRFIMGGHLMDLDWLWEQTISDIRLDLKTIYARNKPFIVCMTDVLTGEAVYRETNAENLEHSLKASSSLPIIYRNFPIVDGRPMADGGLSDSIPVKEAIKMGAKNIMVIRTRKKSYLKKSSFLRNLPNIFLHKYPEVKRALNNRAKIYNQTVGFIRNPPEGINIKEICPPDSFKTPRISKNPDKVLTGYKIGRSVAVKAMGGWD
ncbi:MAG: patatin family protein [Desulfobacterales bacterium]|nr:patatin family protein [Desulfobacterales bacterium]MCP4162213.1 patatin family protein [Deltaproteobacteria bacterium]